MPKELITCPTCGGSGTETVFHAQVTSFNVEHYPVEDTCGNCKGSGVIEIGSDDPDQDSEDQIIEK